MGKKYVSVFRFGVSVFRCFGVSVFRCFGVSVFRCFGVSVFRCFGVSVFRFAVSWFSNVPFVPISGLLNIYNFLVEPYLDYCSIVWNGIGDNLADELQKRQN